MNTPPKFGPQKAPTSLILFTLASLLAYVCWPQDDFIRRIIQVMVLVSCLALTAAFCLFTLAAIIKPISEHIVRRVIEEIERRAGRR